MCLERQIVKRGQQEGEVGEKTIRRGRGRNHQKRKEHRKRKEPPRRRGRGGAMKGRGYDGKDYDGEGLMRRRGYDGEELWRGGAMTKEGL